MSRTRFLLALAALATPTIAQAQSADINALANVFTPISITGANDLDFGDVFPGVNKTVAVANADAGLFSMTGEASAPVNLTFTLPTALAKGGDNLAITSWDACHNATATATGCTSWAPTSGVPYAAAAFSGAGALHVLLGAQVQPVALQAPGAYTAVVSLQIDYL